MLAPQPSIAPINLARAVKFKERKKEKNNLPSSPKEAKKGGPMRISKII